MQSKLKHAITNTLTITKVSDLQAVYSGEDLRH